MSKQSHFRTIHTHELKLLRLSLDVRTVDPMLYPLHVRARVRRDNRKAQWFNYSRLAVLEGR